MAKQYDATFKQLVEVHPLDWIALAGLPSSPDVAVVEAELSSITAAADKVIRVGGSAPYIAHLEFQAGPDPDLDRRLLLYNVLLRWRHNLPVRSVVLLLQPKAMTPRLVCGVTDVDLLTSVWNSGTVPSAFGSSRQRRSWAVESGRCRSLR